MYQRKLPHSFVVGLLFMEVIGLQSRALWNVHVQPYTCTHICAHTHTPLHFLNKTSVLLIFISYYLNKKKQQHLNECSSRIFGNSPLHFSSSPFGSLKRVALHTLCQVGILARGGILDLLYISNLFRSIMKQLSSEILPIFLALCGSRVLVSALWVIHKILPIYPKAQLEKIALLFVIQDIF